MRKTSIIFYVTIILLSASAAIASSKSKQLSRPQYYKSGDNYYYAGLQGIDYVCELDAASICTYYYDEITQQYKPLKKGRFTLLP